jgi:hypothetical protein
VDKSLHKKEFGMSERVLIFESDITFYKQELEYFQDILEYNKNIVFTPVDIDTKFTKIIYNAPIDLEQLRDKEFKYVFILGSIADFENTLHKTDDKQMTLF